MEKRETSAARLLGVGDEAKNGRDRLLDRAIDLFYMNGFHSVGLDNIVDSAGVTKTTFYKHFDSLESLMVAAVERRHQWESEYWGRKIREASGGDRRATFLAVFDLLDQWFNEPEFRGCIFINIAAEFPDPADPVHQAAARYKKEQHESWRALAAELGAKDPDTFADRYAVLVEGTLILRHVYGRNDAARVTRPIAEALVDQHVPRTGAPKARTNGRRVRAPLATAGKPAR